jgi:predicted O-methyltransferase YrrM
MTLSAITKFINARNILEIGTYNGYATLNLAANSPPDATITTIDLPPNWAGGLRIKIPKSYQNVGNRSRIGMLYKDTRYSKKIVQVFGDSAEIDWGKMAIPFDLVFIDGCHHYEYVKKDTQNAIKYLKSGGMIIWHDYGMVRHVSKVVDETAKRLKINAIQGTRLAVGYIE